MADVKELNPALNTAVREHLGLPPIFDLQADPRPPVQPLSLIWHLHFGAMAVFLIGLLVLMILGAF